MIINKNQAYELANALLNAAESVDDLDKDQVVIQFNSDTILSTSALDDGYDEGYTTLARVVGSS